MAIIKYKPTSAGRRNMSTLSNDRITKKSPEKSLLAPLNKKGGRNNTGRITTRHQGGGVKQKYRIIDFKRNKDNVPAKVAGIEYDPNRNANIALLPYGTFVHNVELTAGKGGQLARSAGTSAQILGSEGKFVTIRLASGEVRKVHGNCRATVGVVGNGDYSLVNLGKAGRSRWMGIRPTVRGSAMNPVDHPHGGGEGRAPVGRKAPMTPWGKKAMGLKTRNPKAHSSKYIVRRRNGK